MTDPTPPGTADWAAASRLIRVEEQLTSNEWVPKLWQSDDALLLPIDSERRIPVSPSGDAVRFIRPTGDYDSQRHFLLGHLDGAPRFVTTMEWQDAQFVGSGTVVAASLRDVAANLPDAHRDVAIAAVAITNWHRNEPFCPRCGTPSEVLKAGFMRVCRQCHNEYFPRTDPAVIVAIIDPDDRLLLGRQSSWGKRVSVFAGFVETGESAEQAVHREMAEEVGLGLREVSYFGSQPWPFPRSLMLGFVAYTTETEISTGYEISYADWFTRERLERELAEGTIDIPNRSSIAHRLVTAWRTGSL
ncbi:NAD(+) diphosphatase [Microlunatus sp. Gsoil 973]|uniref:NAD(+) diphosphatase n=1 Tax=Microlunatus sp. Gsoil 973 TaxID=2672569 RepID=UPI0012B4BAE9|nr:NAD(+) diphosphatase [Microlunatus sp. Gsoil 973]QGN32193.1 NAD(+) diphosphatase [Microlunatus sp. Gsoil 973]